MTQSSHIDRRSRPQAVRRRRRRGRDGRRVPDAGHRPGRAAQGRLHAALHRDLRLARQEYRPGLSPVRRRAGRQARRPRGRIRDGRRRGRAAQGARQHEQAGLARQGRRRGRHGAFGRADGDGEDRAREQHAADHSQCRRRRGDAGHVRAQCLPHLVLQLAVVLPDGQGDGRRRSQEGHVHHLEIRRRRGDDRRLQGRFRQGRRQGRGRTVRAVPGGRVPVLPDPDRREEAGRRVHLLRRRRRGEVRQGLPRRRSAQVDPALRRRLPHRRHPAGAGRGGRRHPDHAALRRRPRQSGRQGVPRRLSETLQRRARRLCGAGLRCRRAARASA